jgi:hypothetical protein
MSDKYPYWNELTRIISMCFVDLQEQYPDIKPDSLQKADELVRLCSYLLAMGEKELNWKLLAVEGLICKRAAEYFWDMIKEEMSELNNVDEYLEMYEKK